MITPTRDGLNRLPMEFTLARHYAGQLPTKYPRTEGAGLPSQGVAIVSEFISSARVMRGALMVNPWKVDEMKVALKAALEMKDADRADRMRRNLEFSTRLTTLNWAKEVLHDLKSVEKADITDAYSVGFGMGFRVMGVKAGFHPLDMTAVVKAYRAATHRLIVLDWGGTLVAENDKSDKLQAYSLAKGLSTRTGPTSALKQTLESLCADEKNVVFVVSGKELYAVSDFFGDVQGLGLGAEHGFYYRWPAGKGDDVVVNAAAVRTSSPSHNVTDSPKGGSKQNKWHTIRALGDQSWMKAAKMIMEIYVQRTHGTYIEQKGNELIWQFRDADPEFGFMQSKELESHLQEMMEVYGVEVLRGGGVADGYIEARPRGVNKGLFVNHAVATMKAAGRAPEFVLAVGDDMSDEPMFAALNTMLATDEGEGPPAGDAASSSSSSSCSSSSSSSSSSKNNNSGGSGSGGGGSSASAVSIFSVTVGKKPSAAEAYLDDPATVMEMLNTLNKSTQREMGLSMSNLLTASMDSDLHGHSNATSPHGEGPDDPNRLPSPTGGTIGRTLSTAHLSMSQYLNSIEEAQAEEEDDAGVFF